LRGLGQPRREQPRAVLGDLALAARGARYVAVESLAAASVVAASVVAASVVAASVVAVSVIAPSVVAPSVDGVTSSLPSGRRSRRMSVS